MLSNKLIHFKSTQCTNTDINRPLTTIVQICTSLNSSPIINYTIGNKVLTKSSFKIKTVKCIMNLHHHMGGKVD